MLDFDDEVTRCGGFGFEYWTLPLLSVYQKAGVF